MKKLLIPLCLFGSILLLNAQVIRVVNCEQIHTGFYPKLNADGTQMLLTSENYTGLSVYNLTTKQLKRISEDANAGYEPMYNTDESKIFFRSKTVVDGRAFIAVKTFGLSNSKEQVLLTPRRNVGKMLSYDNGVVFSQDKQLRKATFGKTKTVVPTYVSNEDLNLVLYRNGKRTELHPYAEDVNYIWSSLSPDGTKILFNTKYGTAVCDLTGNILVNLGKLNAPVWYNNQFVLGMYDKDDGHVILSSDIAMVSLDGKINQRLTDGKEIAMYPTASAQTGRIAYNTQDGKIYLMEIQLP